MNYDNGTPKVKVGIMNMPAINFTLNGTYFCNDNEITGLHKAYLNDHGQIMLDSTGYDEEVIIEPSDGNCTFCLHDVPIGIGFHWQRTESQRFGGKLKLIVENNAVTAINIIPVEDYLVSVISSEMNATSSIELLKAHAVISRSWLLAQMSHLRHVHGDTTEYYSNNDEFIKWYDHTDHAHFDVCADDHCQRYQGLTRACTHAVRQAVDATRGQVLMCDGELCDARFSKCCGGVLEQFENCWEPSHHSYLETRRDWTDENDFPDLTKEENAALWIMTSPKAFCNTADKATLQQVLNNYDQETADFYRWHVEYGQSELAQLIAERTGIDFGRIIDLRPVARGTSGRLCKLKIVGEKHSLTIGKELEIRRTLSRSHLYSSAFIVERHDIADDNVPGKFILRGAGWGHGVGLCQIGAAVMGEMGYSYKQILHHYFNNAMIADYYGKGF